MNYLKSALIGLTTIAVITVAATAYAERNHQGKMLERISEKLDLTDTQSAALTVLAEEFIEIRQLIAGDRQATQEEIKALISADIFDQGKALNMLDERAEAFRSNAPELVAAAAVFLDGLSAEQKAQIAEFAGKRGRRHRH